MFSRLSLRPLMAAAMILAASQATAHVTWTQTNQVDPTALAIYHLDDAVFTTGAGLDAAPGWGPERDLVIQAPTGTGFSSSVSAPEPFFGSSLRMDGAQRADSTKNFGYNNGGPDLVDKDLTIEFWLRWDPAPSTSSIEVGLRSGAKLRVTRDTTTPANDRFAIFATHGTFVSAPGFTNWVDVGDDEAALGEWHHFAVTIDSTGSTFDVPSNHHKYNAGTVARFYLNGHEVGTAPHTVALDGTLDFHAESSLLTIRNISGAVTIDEVAIWGADLSSAGTASAPFANGRGSGVSSAKNWQSYE